VGVLGEPWKGPCFPHERLFAQKKAAAVMLTATKR
jgi:hypothetical protein